MSKIMNSNDEKLVNLFWKIRGMHDNFKYRTLLRSKTSASPSSHIYVYFKVINSDTSLALEFSIW